MPSDWKTPLKPILKPSEPTELLWVSRSADGPSVDHPDIIRPFRRLLPLTPGNGRRQSHDYMIPCRRPRHVDFGWYIDWMGVLTLLMQLHKQFLS